MMCCTQVFASIASGVLFQILLETHIKINNKNKIVATFFSFENVRFKPHYYNDMKQQLARSPLRKKSQFRQNYFSVLPFNLKSTSKPQSQKQPKHEAIPVIKINGEQKQSFIRFSVEDEGPSQELTKQESSKSCLLKTKTHLISKKKINFQINYLNFQKKYKTYGNLFIHALDKISCDANFLLPDKEDLASKHFPVQIVNIFYGQNINNYNPYVEALDKLYDFFKGKISKQKMEQIKKLCYIGIAKNYFKSQKCNETPNHRRVNILIRTYIYQNMRSIVEEKAQNYENIVFIPCNKGALNFSHKRFPEELSEICSRQFYQQTIENVNKIIEAHYINYKKMNTKKTVTDRWGQNLVYFLTLVFMIIFLLSNNLIFLYLMAFLKLMSVILYIDECRQTLSMLGSSKNIIYKIQSNLESYLKRINTHNMEWKVGQDFYWLQIHYIRKKKKKLAKIIH